MDTSTVICEEQLDNLCSFAAGQLKIHQSQFLAAVYPEAAFKPHNAEMHLTQELEQEISFWCITVSCCQCFPHKGHTVIAHDFLASVSSAQMLNCLLQKIKQKERYAGLSHEGVC